jgi:GNAT superfamily N-acetyltransferase
VRFVLTEDVQEFAHRAEPLFANRVECNIHATVLRYVIEGRHTSPVLAYGVDDGDLVRFAALRTPPWFMLATELEPDAASQFIERWLDADPEVPGVNALPDTARAIAGAWIEQTGGTTRCRRREAIHVLERVNDPARPAPGGLRLAHHDERPLLVEWMRAFGREAGVLGGDQAAEMVDWPLARGALFVWDDDGPLSMLVISRPTADIARIGPVYTPPEHRQRGYATTMVAAASRQALHDGTACCMLYTDLANPTSNKIYAEIGYRRVADWEEHAFEVASG